MTKFDITQHFSKINVLDHGHVELIDGMVSDPLLKIVNAARVSFAKESNELSEKDERLIRFLYEHEHFSTFRHSYFTFRIKAPLFVFRQWWKYQIGSEWIEHENIGVDTGSIEIIDTSWNEASGRYIEFNPEFYIPEVVRMQSSDNKQGSYGSLEKINGENPNKIFVESSKASYEAYKRLVEAGAAKEQARMLLPQNIYTECVWTCSLQTILFFLHQRTKEDAQWEIREYARATKELMMPLLHVIFEEKQHS